MAGSVARYLSCRHSALKGVRDETDGVTTGDLYSHRHQRRRLHEVGHDFRTLDRASRDLLPMFLDPAPQVVGVEPVGQATPATDTPGCRQAPITCALNSGACVLRVRRAAGFAIFVSTSKWADTSRAIPWSAMWGGWTHANCPQSAAATGVWRSPLAARGAQQSAPRGNETLMFARPVAWPRLRSGTAATVQPVLMPVTRCRVPGTNTSSLILAKPACLK